jgi:hypothetical protein
MGEFKTERGTNMVELPDKVHLVGSVNLDTAADVFSTPAAKRWAVG